jgi:hypothetical protein
MKRIKFKELELTNKMSTEIEILTQLKTQLINFLDELIESFPSEPDFVVFRIFANDRIPITEIMNYIINNLCPLQEMVKTRNEDFFLNYNILFENFDNDGSSKVNHFKRLWTSGNLDKEDKETIWRWFQSFIYLGNKYIECKKK